jgi:uncharacterized membrane protein YqjE
MITELRALSKLQEIVPILIRHLDAYVELAEQDLVDAVKALVAKVRALALLAISALFALAMLCLLVVGATWDGEYRLVAIGSLAGVFLIGAAIATFNLVRPRREAAFATLRREWRQDRAVVEAWLTRDKDEQTDSPPYRPAPYREGTMSARSDQVLHSINPRS